MTGKLIFFKILCLFLSLNISAIAYAQVGGEITVYTNRVDLVANKSYARWVKEFQALYPKARVKIQGIADYEAHIAARLEARNYGDVILVPRDMPKQVYEKYFVPLNDLQLGDKIYFPEIWAYQQHHYAYAQGVIAEGLVYNKTVFEQVGVNEVPTTLRGFIDIAEKLRAAGKIPLALNVGAAWPLQQWDKSVMALADDGDYFSRMIDDLQPFAEGKPYHRSLSIAHHIFASGYSEDDFIRNNWESSKQEFIKNNIAMFYLGNWLIPQLVEQGMRSDDIGFTPFPFDDSGDLKAVLNFDWGMAVSRYSKNKETAKAWIRFVITRSDFADVAGFIPTYKTRSSLMPQLAEYMSSEPDIIQAEPASNDFIRLANKAGMDFMGGNHIRHILLSPDFAGSMRYWNSRWRQARENFQVAE